MGNKYKLTDEYIVHHGVKLFRIEALEDFDCIEKGYKGGFVENELNLAHYGDCWIYDDAKVYGNSRVSGNAVIYGSAEVYDDARVYGNSIVYGSAKVFGNARVFCDAKIYGNAEIYGSSCVYGCSEIYDNVKIHDHAAVYGNSLIFGNANVCGDCRVYGNAELYGDAFIKNTSDYIVFKNWWSSGRYFTWTRSNNKWKVGCFYGTGDELIAKAYKDSELSGREYERVVRYVESILNEGKI